MNRRVARWFLPCVGLLSSGYLAACGSDDDAPAATGAGGSTSAAGTAGAGLGGAGAGLAGTAGKGVTAGTSGASGANVGGGGATAGASGTTAGAAGASGTAAGAAGASGTAGGAGGAAGASGTTAGAGGKAGGGGGASGPTSCEAVRGVVGCCSADGKTTYTWNGGTVETRPCGAGTSCNWIGASYACEVGQAIVDPSGAAPPACGSTVLPPEDTFCPSICKGNADCAASPKTPLCDATSGECVACVTGADCNGNAVGAFCEPSIKRCVACLADTDCKGNPSGSSCDPGQNRCVECAAGLFCNGNPNGSACDFETNRCRECTSDGDCEGSAKGPKCDLSVFSCYAPCTTDAGCKDAARPTCNVVTRICQKQGPTTCDAAQGNRGCCSADGKTVFSAKGDNTVNALECIDSKVCTWITPDGGNGAYGCGTGPAVADPTGVYPQFCGGALLPGDTIGCPTPCSVAADCAKTLGTPFCDDVRGRCAECLSADDCLGNPKGWFCNPSTGKCFK
jgi:hypothetical protein